MITINTEFGEYLVFHVSEVSQYPHYVEAARQSEGQWFIADVDWDFEDGAFSDTGYVSRERATIAAFSAAEDMIEHHMDEFECSRADVVTGNVCVPG